MAKKKVQTEDEIKVSTRQTPAQLLDQIIKKDDSVCRPTGVVNYRIPTGSIGLDRILGGGIPGGRLTQIYGETEVGKSSLANSILAEAQKMELSCVLASLEGTFDKNYAKSCGIDVDNDKTFTWYMADFGEKTLNIIIEMIRNTDAKLIVIDSISAVNPRENIDKVHPEKDLDKQQKIAAQAKLITEFITKSLMPMTRNDVAIVAVNQYRAQIGGYGHFQIVTGGKALSYYTTLKLKLFKEKKLPTDKDGTVRTVIVAEKGKDYYIDAHKACHVEFNHGKGLNKEKEIVLLATDLGIVNKGGAWYTYGEYKWQGADEFTEYLKNDFDLFNELKEKVMSDEKFNPIVSVEDIVKLEGEE